VSVWVWVCKRKCVCVWVCVCVSVCMCSLSFPAFNAHSPYCHLWPAPLYNIFPHYLIKGTIFEKKSYWTTNIVRFPLQILSETVHILRRNGRYMFKDVYCSSCKVLLFWSDFNEYWVLTRVFTKILKWRISWKSVQWESRACRQTNGYNETNSLIFAILRTPMELGVRHPQHTQTGSNSSTIAADSSNGVTNTRCCR
jgi:hypothetical protein